MATKQSHLLLLLVALLLVFSLVLADEKSINGVKRVDVTGAVGKVDQGGGFFGGRGGSGGFGGRRRCFRCRFRGGYCCGFRCCTAEEYKEYLKAEAVPHN